MRSLDSRFVHRSHPCHNHITAISPNWDSNLLFHKRSLAKVLAVELCYTSIACTSRWLEYRTHSSSILTTDSNQWNLRLCLSRIWHAVTCACLFTSVSSRGTHFPSLVTMPTRGKWLMIVTGETPNCIRWIGLMTCNNASSSISPVRPPWGWSSSE